jgi:cytochrome c-type biogenesis protein CcmH/NrfG
MRKYLLHVLIISFVFLLAPTIQVASYAGELEDAKEEVRKNPDDASAHAALGNKYYDAHKYKEAIVSFKQTIRLDPDFAVALLISAFSTSFRGQKFYPACKLLVS